MLQQAQEMDGPTQGFLGAWHPAVSPDGQGLLPPRGPSASEGRIMSQATDAGSLLLPRAGGRPELLRTAWRGSGGQLESMTPVVFLLVSFFPSLAPASWNSFPIKRLAAATALV